MSSEGTGAAAPDQEAPLALRPSHQLRAVPLERVPAAPSHATRASFGDAQAATGPGEPPHGGPALVLPTHAATWVAASVALLASVGWVMERRQRRALEEEKDSVMWADKHENASIITTVGKLDDILPDSPDPFEAARAIYVTAIGETNSRREATLIDLHQLHGKLKRRRERGDNVAALLLLQQHLVDFRYTSPWVFLELLELYRLLDRPMEWDIAREAFRKRFGQNAPTWAAPSTVDAQLADDQQLAEELARDWPFRESRMFILRWMLGEPHMRARASGPALLGLGVYRDLMLLDTVLDDVVVVRTQPQDSLL